MSYGRQNRRFATSPLMVASRCFVFRRMHQKNVYTTPTSSTGPCSERRVTLKDVAAAVPDLPSSGCQLLPTPSPMVFTEYTTLSTGLPLLFFLCGTGLDHRNR
uniref:Uncharacterized protein n=1 Tax=Schistocephalus solidus TaxID=70667 RepID=A0A0V0J8R9_SCHSO